MIAFAQRLAYGAVQRARTLAHAIERAEDYKIPHGEAVAVGMMFAGAVGTLAISFWPYMIPFSIMIAEAAAPHPVLPSCSGALGCSSFLSC